MRSTQLLAPTRGRGVPFVLAVVLALVVAIAPGHGRAAAGSTPVPPHTMGMNVQHVRFYWQGGQPRFDAWERHLAAIAATGIDIIREGYHWNHVEPQPPDPISGTRTYVWQTVQGGEPNYDRWAEARARHGLDTTAVLSTSAPWARIPGTTHTSPPLPQFNDDYAAFAGAVAERYGRNGAFWAANPSVPYRPITVYEIWNEPNLQWNWPVMCATHIPGQDLAPQMYADLFLKAAAAIRAVDPDATILHGGLGGRTRTQLTQTFCTAEEWIRGLEILAPEVFTAADGIAFHAYAPQQPGVNQPAQVPINRLVNFRNVLDNETSGGHLPVWFNENGWVSRPNGEPVTDQERGEYITAVAHAAVLSNCGVRNYSPFTWVSPEEDLTQDAHWFGVANDDGTPKDSGQAYVDLARWLYGLGPQPPGLGQPATCGWRSP